MKTPLGDDAVRPRAEDCVLIGAEREARRRLASRVRRPRHDLFPRVEIEQAHRPVRARRGEHLSVMIERHLVHGSRVRSEGKRRRRRENFRVPNFERTGHAGRHAARPRPRIARRRRAREDVLGGRTPKVLAVRKRFVPRGVAHRARVFEIPRANGPATRGDEQHRVPSPSKPLQRANLRPAVNRRVRGGGRTTSTRRTRRVRRPHANGAVRAAARHRVAVGAVPRASHRARVPRERFAANERTLRGGRDGGRVRPRAKSLRFGFVGGFRAFEGFRAFGVRGVSGGFGFGFGGGGCRGCCDCGARRRGGALVASVASSRVATAGRRRLPRAVGEFALPGEEGGAEPVGLALHGCDLRGVVVASSPRVRESEDGGSGRGGHRLGEEVARADDDGVGPRGGEEGGETRVGRGALGVEDAEPVVPVVASGGEALALALEELGDDVAAIGADGVDHEEARDGGLEARHRGGESGVDAAEETIAEERERAGQADHVEGGDVLAKQEVRHRVRAVQLGGERRALRVEGGERAGEPAVEQVLAKQRVDVRHVVRRARRGDRRGRHRGHPWRALTTNAGGAGRSSVRRASAAPTVAGARRVSGGGPYHAVLVENQSRIKFIRLIVHTTLFQISAWRARKLLIGRGSIRTGQPRKMRAGCARA